MGAATSQHKRNMAPTITESDTKTDDAFHDSGENLQSPKVTDSSTRLKLPTGEVRRRDKRGSSASNSYRMSFYEMVDAHEILPYLLVGNAPSSNDEEFLSRKHVRYALNLSNAPVEYPFDGLEYKSVFIEDEDEEDLHSHLSECLEFLQKVRKESEKYSNPKMQPKVLVYSYFGLSRSCAVVLAHLMKEEGWTLKQAWQYLHSLHPSAKPNDGFLVQLLQYERELYGNRITMTVQDFYSR